MTPTATGYALTIPEAAALLLAALERAEWRFYLDANGAVVSVVGNPLEGATVATILETINLMADDIARILSGDAGVARETVH